MEVIFYETGMKPKVVNIPRDRLNELVGGGMDIEEMICDTAVVWYKNAPIAKDRSRYHRNVFITKEINGEIKTFLTPIYSNFFICGYENKVLGDFPVKYQNEFMAMFGF